MSSLLLIFLFQNKSDAAVNKESLAKESYLKILENIIFINIYL